jgi:hypothetical protein
MSEQLTREERVLVMKAFIRNIGEDRAAAFLLDLQDSIDCLNRNNQAYVAAYREALEKIPASPSDLYCKLCAGTGTTAKGDKCEGCGGSGRLADYTALKKERR